MAGPHLAVYLTLVETAAALLKNEQDPDLKDNYVWTRLSRTVGKRHGEVVELLFEKDTDLESEDN